MAAPRIYLLFVGGGWSRSILDCARLCSTPEECDCRRASEASIALSEK